jgi:hypothetical protein
MPRFRNFHNPIQTPQMVKYLTENEVQMTFTFVSFSIQWNSTYKYKSTQILECVQKIKYQ